MRRPHSSTRRPALRHSPQSPLKSTSSTIRSPSTGAAVERGASRTSGTSGGQPRLGISDTAMMSPTYGSTSRVTREVGESKPRAAPAPPTDAAAARGTCRPESVAACDPIHAGTLNRQTPLRCRVTGKPQTWPTATVKVADGMEALVEAALSGPRCPHAPRGSQSDPVLPPPRRDRRVHPRIAHQAPAGSWAHRWRHPLVTPGPNGEKWRNVQK